MYEHSDHLRGVEGLDKMTLGKKVKEARKSRGLSLSHLSDLLGISPQYLRNIESLDQHIPFDLVLQLSKVLNIDLEQSALLNMQNSRGYRDYKQFMQFINKDAA